MPDEKNVLQCYNKGCGQTFDPDSNNEDSCRHHPGLPIFHDAYKSWSCCNKKCTDFTEFLNIKGCTLSKHSNVKRSEPEKPVAKEVPDVEVIEVKPIVPSKLVRPPFDSPMTEMTPQIAPSLKQQLNNSPIVDKAESKENSNEIAIGTVCVHRGCGVKYNGPETNSSLCHHHPGFPVFHEGLKYWSCCLKKTTDFNAFLSQAGCELGSHVWTEEDEKCKKVQCRWDYHQTGSSVVVSIYAKQYCPTKSVVKLNPVRLYANLLFPEQSNACFNLDIELRGIINVEASQVSMFGTKIEIQLRKAEPGSWSKIEIPRVNQSGDQEKTTTKSDLPTENIVSKIEAVDLDDL